ncbi:U-box domain, partial [Dillenia turbinata]
IKADTPSINSCAEALLVKILEATESTVLIEFEQEILVEIGCYLYRTYCAIKELLEPESTTGFAMEVLQSLSNSFDLAKDLIGQCQKSTDPLCEPESRSIIEQLEEVIRNIGRELNSIASSSFGNQEYAKIAVKSLSSEMQNAHFKSSQIAVKSLKEPEQCEPPSKSQMKGEAEQIETDLYSVSAEISGSYLQMLDRRHVIEFLKNTRESNQTNCEFSSTTSSTSLQVPQHIKPLYETFFCPLTRRIMDEPVTIESGITFEKKAIAEWFEMFTYSEEIFCPVTGKKLPSRGFSTNIALKTTIDEWKNRNEAARIKVVQAALSLASSDSMVLEALQNLQNICQGRQYNKMLLCNAGIIPLLVKFLEYKDRKVRCTTLETLRRLAEEDDESKEMIAKTMAISSTIRMLSSNHRPIKHASLLFLLELSKSQGLCEAIGSAPGGILLLITIKYNWAVDGFASQKAEQVLMNLEKSPNNVKLMAENGLLEPLLNRLIRGSEEMKMEMGSFLGEIVLGHESKIHVAERASPVLIEMVHNGNTLARKAAFKALLQLSSYHQTAKTLVEAGIMKIMIEEMFTRKIYNEPMNSKNEAAAILANILECGLDPETFQVNDRGRAMGSDYVIYNIIYMLKNSTPDELNVNLIRIILCLTKSPKSTAMIVSVVKETEASHTLAEFINNPLEKLGVASLKLLISLSPYMGHTIADRLCKTSGLPQNLIQKPSQIGRITEKQALSANLLAKLPHQNLTLNLALLSTNLVPTILQVVSQIQRIGMSTSRYTSSYFEGLVGILVRFTTTLYEPQMVFLARNFNFTSVFTELLMKTSTDEVQRLSAIGLENLSSQSVNLSKPPEIIKRKKFMKLCHLPKFLTSGRKKKIQVCPVHRGSCSSQYTFCLVDANAVERLLACLENENEEVVEAAMSAISTLLDDKVDLNNSVSLLSGVNAIPLILNVLREHRQEGLWKKSFWVIERFLMKGGDKSITDISQDGSLRSTLVSAIHNGDQNTRLMAEKILRHLNQVPNLTM